MALTLTMTMNATDVAGWKVEDEMDDKDLMWMPMYCNGGQSYAGAANEGLFSQLPNELIRHVYSFFDIASLGSMAQINRCPAADDADDADDATKSVPSSPSLSSMAVDNDTWSDLVHRRFQINTQKTRSKSFGGQTWKDAYRMLSQCNRAPKCRFTASRKVIFAKSSSSSHANNSSSPHANNANSNKLRTHTADPLSVWVLLNHTENCETRRTAPPVVVDHPFLSNMMMMSPNNQQEPQNNPTFNSRHGRRYVEFNVCLQNVKLSAGPITVDLLSTTLTVAAGIMGSHEAVQVKGMPRKIHHHKHLADSSLDTSSLMDDDNDDANDDGLIILQPFDFCVVTMSFACGYDVFETDLLARAVALQVAVLLDDDNNSMHVRQCEDRQRQVSASFVPESDLWQCYMELPGGFLTLSDKTQLISV